MRRRELMLLLGGAMTAPRALSAQQKATPVIGYLNGTSPGPAAPFAAAFHQGLSETAYVEGQNVAIEYRWAEGHYDRLPALFADLAARKVDAIVAGGGSTGALAAKSVLMYPPPTRIPSASSRNPSTTSSPGRASGRTRGRSSSGTTRTGFSSRPDGRPPHPPGPPGQAPPSPPQAAERGFPSAPP